MMQKEKINTQFPKVGKVDIVYIWCDSNQPGFTKNRNFYSKQYKINNYWSKTRDHDEITHSVKSVRKYMKWVRTIYICSPKDHKIKNLDEKKYNIKYVTNEEILGIENCPNFNSHSLELFTYKIKGLSDFFIQFNDDFFVNNEIKLDDFYNFKTKKIKYFYENFLFLGKPLSFTTRKVIQDFTGEKYYFWPTHEPRLFYKDDIKEIVNKYQESINLTKKSKFRNKYDFQLVHFYGYYILKKGKGEFIFLENIVSGNNLWYSSKVVFGKFFSENILSILHQIYLQIFYKRYLYKNKKFSRERRYALIRIGNDCKQNKKNIDLALHDKVKFICLNDLYKVRIIKEEEKIVLGNYKYFYKRLLEKGKK